MKKSIVVFVLMLALLASMLPVNIVTHAVTAGDGTFTWPVSASVDGTTYDGHGMARDFAVGIGTPVYAIADGTVVTSIDCGCLGSHYKASDAYKCPNGVNCQAVQRFGSTGSYANYIIIDHGNGFCSLYAHLKTGTLVSVGQRVVQGQSIAQSGNAGKTGGTTGAHLHLELSEGNTKIEPLDKLTRVNVTPGTTPPAGGGTSGGGTVTPTPDPEPVPQTIIHVDYPATNANGDDYLEVSGWIATNSPFTYLIMQIENYENDNGGQINLGLYDSPSEAASFTHTYFKRFRGVIEAKYLTINEWYPYLIFNNEIPAQYEGSFKFTGVYPPPSQSVITIDYPNGHYDEYNHIELKGWIAANEPISYVMAEIVGVTQYDMNFYDYPDIAGLKALYPQYTYFKQFYTVIDINLLKPDSIYTLYVWTNIGDGIKTKTFSTGAIQPDYYTFSFNGGEGVKVPDAIKVAPGETCTLPSTIPVRAGYNFLGWSADANIDYAKHFPGDQIVAGANYDLHAVWEAAPFYFKEGSDVSDVKIDDLKRYIRFGKDGTTVDSVKSLFHSDNVTVTNSNGETVTSGNVGTGATITSTMDGKRESLVVVVLGDVTGDGRVSTADYAKVMSAVKGKSALVGELFDAANIVSPDSDKLAANDYAKIKSYISGKIDNF